ncbi:MAG TPA: ABC transporter permease [Pilimelia sp.]|nr:ABC transporter permease [Pilimelia sp.]
MAEHRPAAGSAAPPADHGAAGGRPPGRSRRGGAHDAGAMVWRSVRLSARHGEALLMALVLPVLLLVVFVYLFGGAIRTGTAAYVDFVVPGVLVMCAGFVSGATAVGVTQDLATGMMDRLRSMDVGGAAVLSGHVAASAVRTAVMAAVLVAVAVLVGFRPVADPVAWVAAAGVLGAYALALSWLAAAFGLLARTPEGAGGFQFVVMFVPYLSSGFVPIDTMPRWLRPVAAHQPVTPVIEAVRDLLVHGRFGAALAAALGWSAVIALASVGLATVLFRRRTAG